MADNDWSTMADIYRDLLPNLVAFSLRDKETGESETNLNNVIFQDSIDLIAHLEESPEARAFVRRAVPWDCRRDLQDGVPCFLRYSVEGDVMHQSICNNPKCREDNEKPMTQEEFLAGLGITSASSSDVEQREFQATYSAMADYYEHSNTTSARAGDIDQYEYDPATSTAVNEYQCGNDDPMYLGPVVSDVQDTNVEDSLYLRAKNFETAVENTSARASDMEHHEYNAEISATEGDIESNGDDASDIMSECTCSILKKCHCYDPRYLGPGVDASVQNEEKDCVRINIEEFETDVDKTADNVDDANAKVAIPESPDANAKVVIEVPQKAAKEGIRTQQNNRYFEQPYRSYRLFSNILTDDDWTRRTVQVRLPGGSEELRELEKLFLMSMLKSMLLLLFLKAAMLLLKKCDPTLDNFFLCFAYYACYYLGGTLAVCIYGSAFIKIMEFFFKKCASKRTRLLVAIFVLLLNMLWTYIQLQLFISIGQCYQQCGTWQCKMVVNALLVAAFVFQHSLQKRRMVKDFFKSHGWASCERLLYNLGSSISLLALMNFWQAIPDWTIWEIDTPGKPLLRWIFFTTHCVSWLFIYSGCYIMDISELLGVKQVLHSINNEPDPMSRKSEGLQRFYSHMRHPSLSAICAILFLHPIMQVDRLLLGYSLVAYVVLRTQVDEVDYAYQKRLLQRKKQDLNCLD
ncbi:hypothetical protein JTE90_006057 [Oedothorax gibbosus]|uniref:Nuclear envelope membrane protein n=1 Tax=Oedothorax gibbosus TaxID=931172 RepID=A0AAV6V3L8_9ARAC|nr:hypothetical protein JTE90_006057 [Oedothorax gibbosus]